MLIGDNGVMKGIGGYTIFHYFPAILCQTMGECGHVTTQKPHWACSGHRKCPLSMPSAPNPCISCQNHINSPPQVHPFIGWPGLLLKTSKLHVTDNSQVDRTFLFIFNYLIIEMLFNYSKCLNIIRTPSKTSFCTLQGRILFILDFLQIITRSYRLIARLCLLKNAALSRVHCSINIIYNNKIVYLSKVSPGLEPRCFLPRP